MTSLFEEERNPKTGKYELKGYNYRDAIGIDRDMADVYGFDKLNDVEQEYLTFLYRNYNRPDSGFIKASKLALMFHTTTRQIRQWNYRIDDLTNLVIWSSYTYNGIKLASTDSEITQAIDESLAQAKGGLRHAFAKAKNKDLKYTHNIVGFNEKRYQGKPEGQLEMKLDDEEGGFYVVKHYPKQDFEEYVGTEEERIKAFQKER